MIQLVLALAFLFLTHYGISSTRLRDDMVARLGEMPYRAVYSLVSLAALVWLARAYGGAAYVPLWPPLPILAVVTYLCMFLACLLLIGGLSTPNPTAMEQSKALERPNLVQHCCSSADLRPSPSSARSSSIESTSGAPVRPTAASRPRPRSFPSRRS
jgi:uncharacterized membrane protein